MTGKLAGKIALVTGSGRGIGRAIALRLAAEGATVAINYSRSEAAANQAADQIKAAGGNAFTIAGDVSDLKQIDHLMTDLSGRVSHLDILVNNAGHGAGLPTLEKTTVEEFDSLFGLNTRGLFFVTQHAARMMRNGGRIVSLSSTGSHARVAGLSVYSGTKAAVEAFTRVWAKELAPRQITVNSVSPGMVDTDMIAQNMPEGSKEWMAKHHPFGRVGQPQDLADAIAFLCSDDARWISGQNIVVDGGGA